LYGIFSIEDSINGEQFVMTFFQTNLGKVVMKFNFISLFSKAWSQAVTPANIISGFRTCGFIH